MNLTSYIYGYLKNLWKSFEQFFRYDKLPNRKLLSTRHRLNGCNAMNCVLFSLNEEKSIMLYFEKKNIRKATKLHCLVSPYLTGNYKYYLNY